jgi:hypothetical protein
MTTYYMRTRFDAAHLPAPVQEGERPGMTACGLLLFSDAIEVDDKQVLVYLSDGVCFQCDPHRQSPHANRHVKLGRPKTRLEQASPERTQAMRRVMRWAAA